MGVSKYKESAPGSYYHVYNRGNQKRDIFLDSYDYFLYLKRLIKACEKYSIALVAYCLMPNHYHEILRQDGEYPPSKIMASVNTSYSMIYNKKYQLVGHVFQDRFKQKIIEGDQYLLKLIAYLHLNPVKAGLCKKPDQYPYSSFAEYAGLTQEVYCDQKLINSMGLKDKSFVDFVKLASQIMPEDVFDE